MFERIEILAQLETAHADPPPISAKAAIQRLDICEAAGGRFMVIAPSYPEERPQEKRAKRDWDNQTVQSKSRSIQFGYLIR